MIYAPGARNPRAATILLPNFWICHCCDETVVVVVMIIINIVTTIIYSLSSKYLSDGQDTARRGWLADLIKMNNHVHNCRHTVGFIASQRR